VQSQLAELANHWLVLSLLAVLSFWYLWGWREALLIALVVVLHELGHAAAMRMVGIPVQGIYLIPFFGGAAVPKTAYRSLGQLGFVALMGPGFSLIPTLALAWLYYTTADPWALHAAFMFALINGGNLLPIYPLDGGQILNALLASLSRHIANAAAWIGVLTGLGAALYLQSLLLGIPFLLFALQLAPSGTRTAGLTRLTSLSGATLVLAFVATFALYLATFLYANNTKSVLAGGAVGPLEALVGIPVRCDLPSSSAALLERFLSEPGGLDALSFIRLLAQADRAGHGNIVRRWLEAPGFNPPPDLGSVTRARIPNWLALAKSGPLAAIEAEIAGRRAPNDHADLRDILTDTLVVHGRFHEALALLPPSADRWKRLTWLHTTLVELVSAGAIAEAVSLLERTKSDTVEMGHTLHLLNVARKLQRLPSTLGDKKSLIAAIADQLHTLLKAEQSSFLPACLPGTSKVCTDDDKRNLARNLRGPDVRASEIEALAGFGQIFDLPDEFRSDPRQWWHVHAVLAAALAEQGDAAGSDGVRNHVVKALAAPAAQAPGYVSHERDYPRPTAITDLFETAYATTRISLRLSHGDVEGADALAQSAIERFKLDTGILSLMVNHYLSWGQWSRADAWQERHVLREPEAGRDERLDEELEAQAFVDLNYQLNVAAAAAKLGEVSMAGSALQRARSISCTLAKSTAYLREEWSRFLRRAFQLKAFQEGRLPPYALDRP
jgi:Zn-dependent protease